MPHFGKPTCQITQARHSVYFMLIGKDTELLTGMVETMGLTERVHLLGHRHGVSSLLPGTDIVCLSSAFGEGFPNVLGEAMACGIPCVSTDVGDARSIIANTGVVVPSRSPSSLANALIELIDRGAAVCAGLGRSARQRVASEYSLQHIIVRYEKLYLDLSWQYQLQH